MTTIRSVFREGQDAHAVPFFGALSRTAVHTCLFGAFAFLQFTVLGLANHAGEGYLTAAQRDLVYYGLQVLVILGYLLYSGFAGVRIGNHIRKTVASGVFALLFFSVAIMLGAGTASFLNVIASAVAALCVGGIGGAAHHRMSQETAGRSDAAKCMGFGSAAAIALQYLLQIRQGVSPLLPVFMTAALFLLGFLLLRGSPEAVPEEPAEPVRTSRRQLLSAVLIAAVFILFTCFYNETIHHLMIQSGYSSYNVYSWPRLMLIPGYLLFAAIGDRKNGKYVPIVSLCVMLIALLNVVLIGDRSAYWFNMCLFYFSIAAFTSYYLLTFWRLAPGTKHPAFWAPMGRMLDSAMVLLTGAIGLSAFSAPVVLGIDIAGVALVILLMALSGSFTFSDPPARIADEPAESASERNTAAYTAAESVSEQNITAYIAAEDTLLQVAAKIQASPGMMSEEDALLQVPSEIQVSPVVLSEQGALPQAASEIQAFPGVLTEQGALPQAASEIQASPGVLSEEEALNRMRIKYNLSSREEEVLRELVLTDDKQAVISERLSIRIRTLQNHVTQIYRKVGVTTRAGLTDLYHETRLRT